MSSAEKAFWLEAAEGRLRAEERLREGDVPPADVFKLAMIATGGDEREAAQWVAVYAEADAKAAVRRHHARGGGGS